MYKEFIDLKDAPLETQKAVENIYKMIGSNYEHEVEWKEVWTFLSKQKPEQLMAEILTTVEYDDKDILFLFQIAIYIVCTVHIPFVLEKVKNNNDEEHDIYLYMTSVEDHLSKWEGNFWIYTMSNLFHPSSVIKKDDANYYKVEETMKSAFKEKYIMESVESLLQQYEPFICKAKKINKRVESKRIQVNIAGLKRGVDIIERHLQGNLSGADVKELEENASNWNREWHNLTKFFDDAI